MIRTVLVEDHELVRAGFRSLLSEIPGLLVVGEATNGREGVEVVRTTSPDLVITDIAMKELNGIDATMQIKAQRPDTHVIVVSMHAAEEIVTRALRAGASGYLVKDCVPMDLRLAIEAVMRGEIYLAPRISRTVFAGLLANEHRADASGTLDTLTLRQREILQLMVKSKATKQIASILGLSTKTVESHRAAIMERLGIHSVAGLVVFALRSGIVPLDFDDGLEVTVNLIKN